MMIIGKKGGNLGNFQGNSYLFQTIIYSRKCILHSSVSLHHHQEPRIIIDQENTYWRLLLEVEESMLHHYQESMIIDQENPHRSLLLKVEESSLVPGSFHPKIVLLPSFPLALPPADDGQS